MSAALERPAIKTSNIKTLRDQPKLTAPKLNLKKTLATSYKKPNIKLTYQHRFLVHLVLMSAAGFVLIGNNPARAHGVSVRLMAAHAGVGAAVDETAASSIAGDIAVASSLMVVPQAPAASTDPAHNQPTAILTSDDDTLAKRQVIATAGNATRDITHYAVEPGDTLSGLAQKFNITTDTLKAANNLSDADAIKPGQNLVILPVSGLLYMVKAGDTPDSLAGAYQANAAQIVSFNNAEVSGIQPGTQIIIPDGVLPAPPAPAPTQVAATRGSVAGASAPRLTSYAFSGNGYVLGYCTYYVALRRSIPSDWGNANQWYYNAQASGFSVGAAPIPGAIAWTGAGYYGHVAYVEGVSGGMVTVSEMNYNGNWDRVTSRTVSASTFRYIY